MSTLQNSKKKIFIFSSVHPWNDGRIFFRQARSLAKECQVELHAIAEFDFREVEGINVFGIRPWKNFWDRIAGIVTLLGRIIKSNADVFHFHDPELLLIVPLVSMMKRKPVVYDVHENYYEMIEEKEYLPGFLRKTARFSFALAEKIILPFISIIIYVTDQVGFRYQKQYPEKSVKVRNLPSLELFYDTPIPYKKRGKVCVYAGYLTPTKGIRELIQAFAKIHEYEQNYTLHIFGSFFSESFENEIKDMIVDLSLEDVVLLKGGFQYNTLSAILSDARIGFLTYNSVPNNIGGFPNKLIEYMGAGLAIVASDFENYKEVILSAGSGLTAIPENIDELAETAIRLIDDEDLAEQFSLNGREAFISEYNWESEQRHLLNAYKKILN